MFSTRCEKQIVSGVQPIEPAISKKSGHLFEKRLIMTYISKAGHCPITGEPLTADDILPLVQTGTVAGSIPRPTGISDSIPSLLRTLQSEWDATMLESFQLKQHLDQARQELATALYQHDAACRVIARLVQERDQAREALKNAQAGRLHDGAGASGAAVAMATDETTKAGLPDDVWNAMQANGAQLMSARTKRAVSRTLATQDDIAAFECAHSEKLHGTPVGITCMTQHPSDARLIVTGGNDGSALIYNHAQSAIAAELRGHTARINSVAAGEQVVLTASADRTARVWRKGAKKDADFEETLRFSEHSDEVTVVAVHPLQTVAATASKDASWALHAIDSKRDVPLITCKSTSAFLSGHFHPDGLLLGLGDAHGTFALYVLNNGSQGLAIDAHQGGVAAVAFNENGYLVATGGVSDNAVKLWDIRKSRCLHTVKLEAGFGVRALAFDDSGVYLAASGADVRVFAGKTLSHVKTFTDHAAPVTGVCFGPDAAWLATASIDRTVRFWKKS